jgi:hypothetical protein
MGRKAPAWGESRRQQLLPAPTETALRFYSTSKEAIMTKAEELNFDLNDQTIFFSGRGKKLQHKIECGNGVTLSKGNVKVYIKNVTRNTDNSYIGKVDYVDPYKALSGDGISDGFRMTFLHGHVFVCQH